MTLVAAAEKYSPLGPEEPARVLMAALNEIHLRGELARFEDDARGHTAMAIAKSFPRTFGSDGAVRSWMHKVMTNYALDMLRREKRHVEFDEGSGLDGTVRPEIDCSSDDVECRVLITEIAELLNGRGVLVDTIWRELAREVSIEDLAHLRDRLLREDRQRRLLRALLEASSPNPAKAENRMREFESLCAFADGRSTIEEIAAADGRNVSATYTAHTRLRARLLALIRQQPEAAQPALRAELERLRQRAHPDTTYPGSGARL